LGGGTCAISVAAKAADNNAIVNLFIETKLMALINFISSSFGFAVPLCVSLLYTLRGVKIFPEVDGLRTTG
jgi:hypothetical protein